MPLNMEKLRKFARLHRKLEKVKRVEAKLKRQIKELEEPLIQHMADEQTDKVNVGPEMNVKITSLLFAKYPNPQAAMDALKDAGHEDMISENFDRGRLNALIREYAEMGEPLPDCFEGRIVANEKFYIKVNKH